MKPGIYITSKYYFEPNTLKWIASIFILADIFFSEYIPQSILSTAGVIIMLIYVSLLFCAFFFLLFSIFSNHEIEEEIKNMDCEAQYNDKAKHEKHVSFFQKLKEKKEKKNVFVYLLKSKEDLTHITNINNYLLVLAILYFAQHSFDCLKPVGVAFFIVIIIFIIVFFLRIIFWEVFERKNILSAILIGNVLAVCFLFFIAKHTYIRNYGDEIIGSYFEKSEYKTQYYINVFTDKELVKNYRLPANISVYTETYDGEMQDGFFSPDFSKSYSSRCIVLEDAYWPNGNYMDFNGYKIDMGQKVLWYDKDGKEWYIELTNEKVK